MHVTASHQPHLTKPLLLDLSGQRDFKTLLTYQLRAILEQRSVRFAVVGMMLVAASAFALVPTPAGVDYSWIFIVPVAVSAIAAGLSEGMLVAFLASVLCALYASAFTTFSATLLVGTVSARFALYGLTAAVLGAFAEAHHSVQMSLRRLTEIDPLTKVSNVSSLYEHLAMLEKEQTSFAVLVVDVDDLKKLNDTYGHQVGTQAIQSVANALRRVIRGSDQVARYGGDEFVVVLREADRAGAQIVINRMREMLEESNLSGADGVSIKVSVGCALSGEDGSTGDQLLAAADSAMYVDKQAHKKTVRSSAIRRELLLPTS
jgi:diguanylate cyclase (GGDEF)-like protein